MPESCDLLVRNGLVLTVDADGRKHPAGAVAITGRDIVAVGADAGRSFSSARDCEKTRILFDRSAAGKQNLLFQITPFWGFGTTFARSPSCCRWGRGSQKAMSNGENDKENDDDKALGQALEGGYRTADRIITLIENREIREEAERQLNIQKVRVLEPGLDAWSNLGKRARILPPADYDDIRRKLQEADNKANEAIDTAAQGLDALRRGDKDEAKDLFKEAARLGREAARMYRSAQLDKELAVERAIEKLQQPRSTSPEEEEERPRPTGRR